MSSLSESWRPVGDAEVEDDDQQFEIDFALMSGELALLLADLTKALGGEKPRT